MTRVKICGMQSMEDIRMINELPEELHPEYVGFIFTEKSRRHVSPKFAKQMRAALNPNIKTVGVFQNEDPNTIATLVSEGTIDLIQLHGNESEDDIDNIRALTPAYIIKAFTVRSEEDLEKALRSSANYVMLDNGGGSGEAFDWQQIHDFPRRFFLAGGLHAKNVRNAINVLHPYAVDVSSGVERKDLDSFYKKDPQDRDISAKDPEKTELFLREAKGISR